MVLGSQSRLQLIKDFSYLCTYFLLRSRSTHPLTYYTSLISIAVPSGFVFVFNVKKNGMSQELRELLLDNRYYFVGFHYTEALENTFKCFRGVQPEFDVRDCLNAIVEHQLLPHLFPGLEPSFESVAKILFGVEQEPPDESSAKSHDQLIKLAFWRASLALDTYVVLCRHMDDLNSEEMRFGSGEVARYPILGYTLPAYCTPTPSVERMLQ